MLLLGVVCLGAQPVPVVAIVSDPGLRNEAALLTAALGRETALQLVEREQMDKILGEQKLAAAGLTRAESVRLGKLCRAQGLLILQRIAVAGQARMALRLVAVEPGVIVSDEQYSTALLSEDGIATVLLPRLQPLWPKLTVSAAAAMPISVAGLHAPVDTVAFKELERELTLLLIHRLTREPELFVLERRNMESLAAEKNLPASGTVSAFLTGRCLAEGSFVEKGQRLAITLRLQFPGINESREVRAEGPRDDRPALLDDLARQVLAALRKTPASPAWSAAAEARAYQEQAGWALQHQLFPEAQSAAETSWALGGRGEDLSELRLSAYCLAAYPYWGSSGKGYYPHALDVRKEPQRLEYAIRAVEILLDQLETQPRIERPYSWFDDMVGNAPTHQDYRILSTRVLLSASRVLRTFYEDSAYAGYEDRLAYLRRLLRDAAAILLRDGGTADDRGLWIYKIQSAYAPYWYEHPEDVIAAYRILLRKNIAGWLTRRDPVDSDNRPIHGRPVINQKTPWVLAWDKADADRVARVWKAFLDELRQSSHIGENAAYWMVLQSSEDRAFSFELLRDFLWNNRAEIAPANKQPHFVWDELCQAFAYSGAADRATCLRFYEYLMREGSRVKEDFVARLLDTLIQTKEDQTQLPVFWKSYEARMREELPAPVLKAYMDTLQSVVRNRFGAGWLEAVQAGFGPRPLKISNDRYPPPPANALPVTRFWTPWTSLEAPFRSTDIKELKYCEGKVWFITELDRGHIVSVDLATFKTGRVEAPQLKESWWRSSLAVSRQHLYLATGEGASQYDLKTGKWKALEVPPGSYAVQFIEPYCYLLFDQTALDQQNHARSSPLGSGVYRFDPRTDKLELLTSTRRRPPLSALDSSPIYLPRLLTQDAKGSLYLTIDLDHQYHRALYQSGPDGTGWEPSVECQKQSALKVHQDPGGMFVQVHNSWIAGRYFKYFPDFGGGSGMETLLAGPVDNKSADSRSSKWKLPGSVNRATPDSRLVRDAACGAGNLWLLTMRSIVFQEVHTAAEPVVHCYAPDQSEPVDVPLDLQISEAEQRTVIERARGTAGNKELDEMLRLKTIPKLKAIDAMLLVPEGVVLYSIGGHGFWFLPFADLNKYLEARSATAVDGDRR